MGKTLIKSDMIQVIRLIKTWAQDHNLTVAEKNPAKTDVLGGIKKYLEFEGKGRFYTVVWQCQTVNDDIVLNLILKPKQYITLILHALLFGGLLYSLRLIQNLLIQFDYSEVFLFLMLGIFLLLTIWWKDNRLSLKLIRIEKSFWSLAGQTNNLLQLTRLRAISILINTDWPRKSR